MEGSRIGGTDTHATIVSVVGNNTTLTIEGCTIKDADVSTTGTGSVYAGGLIGYSSNGACITIKDCKVNDVNVSGTGSVGTLFGHAVMASGTSIEVSNTSISNSTVTYNGDATYKAGVIAGTLGQGMFKIKNISVDSVKASCVNNDVTTDVSDCLFGRMGSTGHKLVLDDLSEVVFPNNELNRNVLMVDDCKFIEYEGVLYSNEEMIVREPTTPEPGTGTIPEPNLENPVVKEEGDVIITTEVGSVNLGGNTSAEVKIESDVNTNTGEVSASVEVRSDGIITNVQVSGSGDSTAFVSTTVVSSESNEVDDDLVEKALLQAEVANNVAKDRGSEIGTSTIVFDTPVNSSGNPELVISTTGIGVLADKNNNVAITNGNGCTAEISTSTMEMLAADQSGAKVTFTFETKTGGDLIGEQKGVVNANAAVIELDLLLGEQNIHDLNGSSWIWMPFSHDSVNGSEDLRVSYIDPLGNRTTVPGHEYRDGKVGFPTGHYSTFAVEALAEAAPEFMPPTFIPIPDDDFLPPVQVVKPQEDDATTKIACVAAGAVAALLAILLVATSRGKL